MVHESVEAVETDGTDIMETSSGAVYLTCCVAVSVVEHGDEAGTEDDLYGSGILEKPSGAVYLTC